MVCGPNQIVMGKQVQDIQRALCRGTAVSWLQLLPQEGLQVE